jgi:hypothetical protein
VFFLAQRLVFLCPPNFQRISPQTLPPTTFSNHHLIHQLQTHPGPSPRLLFSLRIILFLFTVPFLEPHRSRGPCR